MMYFRNLMGGKFEIPENAIIYTPKYGSKLSLSDPNIIKHQYNSGTGYVTYNSDTLSAVFNRYGSSIISITLPPTITILDEYAFLGCHYLTTLTLPNTFAESRYHAFYNCSSLLHVHIPDLSSWLKIKYTNNTGHPFWAVTSGDLYINGEKLTDITIPEDITAIPFSAFCNCKSLTNITIPNHVTTIKRLAFDGCDITKIVIPDSVTTIQDMIFKNCTKLKEVTLPQPLTAITELMFMNCSSFPSIILPTNILSIEAEAFSGCSSLASIYLNKNLEEIKRDAFKDCAALKSVHIEDIASWCKLKSSSFPPYSYNLYLNNNLLTSIHIPEDITEITSSKFANLNVDTITFTDLVTSIADYAFNNSSITSINFPKNLTSIGANAFYKCSLLKSVYVNDSLQTVASAAFSNCNNLKEVYITSLENWCNIDFSHIKSNPLYSGKLYINELLITDLIIPSGVTTIKLYAFSLCVFNSITIPESVKSIGLYAFMASSTNLYCSDLEQWCNIDFSNYIYSGKINFYINNDLISDVIIPSTVTKVKAYTFAYLQSLQSITLHENVTSIEGSAFYSSGLKYINIPDERVWCNLELEYNSITNSNIKLCKNNEEILNFNIPDDIEEIKPYSFNNASYKVTIGSGVKTINDYAFLYYLLDSIVIPYGVSYIGKYVFAFSDITSIDLPSTVTTISTSAFSGCSSLNYVNIHDIQSWCNIDFSTSYSNPLYYSKSLYLNDSKITNLVIPEGTTTIKYLVFSLLDIETLYVPNSITYIGKESFNSCRSLKTVIIDNSSAVVGVGAFSNCELLESVELGNNILSIELEAFLNCTSLKSIHIPGNVSAVKNSAFYYNTALSLVTIDEGVSEIGASAFGYTSITSIKIPNSVTSIYSQAFYKCTLLESIILSSNITTIPEKCFLGCTSLKSIEIPSNITYIDYYAFDSCSLESVYITDLSAWLNIQFNNSYSNPLNKNTKLYLNNEELVDMVIPKDVTELKLYSLNGSFNSINIHDLVTVINDYAFLSCDVKEVIIGEGVTSLYGNTFYNTYNLNKLYLKSKTVIELSSLFWVTNFCTIYVPIELVDLYRLSEYWSNVKYLIEGFDFENNNI